MVTKVMKQIKARSLELMIVALGFAAGGIWKDAIAKWLEPITANKGEGAMELTFTALIVTVVVVLVIIALTKVLGEEE